MDNMKEMNMENEANQSFVISIKSQVNHTWQGSVTWVEGKKQQNFRSVLELLKLMDSVVGSEEK